MQKLKRCVFQAILFGIVFAKYDEKNTKKSSHFYRIFIVLFFSESFCGFLKQKLSEIRRNVLTQKKRGCNPSPLKMSRPTL
jgi:hypothetical protein